MSDVPLGRFVWYELLTSDPKAAQGFYSAAIGWTTQGWGDGPEPYTMWMAGEIPVGGVMTLPEEAAKMGAPPHWLAYISTPNADDTVAKATAAGGTALKEPFDIPEVGRIAILQDPQGAVVGLLQPSGDPPPRSPDGPGPGEFSWNELVTSDYDAAFDFYSKVFGWKKTEAMDMGDMGTYQMYGLGEETFGGMMNKPADQPGPPAFWLYYTTVADVNAAVDKVKTAGGQVLNGPMEVPGGDMVAQCMDPQGVAFAVHAKP